MSCYFIILFLSYFIFSFEPIKLFPLQGFNFERTLQESLNLIIISISLFCPLKFKMVFCWLVSKESISSCPNIRIDVLNVHKRFRSNFLLLEEIFAALRGCPFKNRPLDFRPKTEFLQIFRVRQLVHVINKNGNNLAFNAIFQYFWRQFQRTVQNRLNRSVSSQI